MAMHTFTLRYPNPLPKAQYPKHTANDWYEAAELFKSFLTNADLADHSKTSLPGVATCCITDGT